MVSGHELVITFSFNLKFGHSLYIQIIYVYEEFFRHHHSLIRCVLENRVNQHFMNCM